MRQFFSLFCFLFSLISLNASAFLITDTFTVERHVGETPTGTTFELIPLGYNPATDAITHVKLIYAFSEIYSSNNLGDEEEYDGTYPQELYENELTLFSSWMFIWREMVNDVDTGLTVFEKDWIRTDACQLELATDPEVMGTEYCALNMDMLGNVNAYLMSFTDNLWLHSITLEVEVDRKAEVSEPNPSLLFGLGLLAIGLLRYRARD